MNKTAIMALTFVSAFAWGGLCATVIPSPWFWFAAPIGGFAIGLIGVWVALRE